MSSCDEGRTADERDSSGERGHSMDQQPQYQPQTVSGSSHGVSSVFSSLGSDIMAGLAYLIVVVPFVGFILQIVMFVMEKNRFTKFHAAQAMILSIVSYALWFVYFIITTIFTVGADATNSAGVAAGALGLTTLLFCVFGIIGVVLFAFWIWGMISAFTGKATKLPVIGNFAEGFAGGPVA